MLDSRSPWYSVGASRSDLEATSSNSLLHSIYGSQASQLLYTDSETSLHGTRSTEYVPPSRSRTLTRPKSSPASVFLAREQQKKLASQNSRPFGAAVRQRPGTAVTTSRPRSGISRARPISAAATRPRRPSTAAVGFRGGATRTTRSNRPATALGSRHSLTQLVDLEEEEEEPPPVIRDTAPVHLTRTPEYVYFWEGKPLQQRDFGVKPQKRKAWRRPKSDYGNRFLNKRSGQGTGDDDGMGLETLVEKEDSNLGSDGGTRRGSRDFGSLDRDGRLRSGDGEDLLRGSRRGSKDSDDGKRKNRSKDGDRKKGSGGLDRSKWSQRNKDSTEWDNEDASKLAEEDEFFKKSEEGASDKELELPPIPSNANLCTVQSNKENRVLPSSLSKSHDFNLRNNQKSHDHDQHNSNRKLKVIQPNAQLSVANSDLEIPTRPRKVLASLSWMDGGGSSNTTRFELPMDMKQLEGMSPLQYLRKHCIISNRRMAHCSKVFTKLDRDKDTHINKEEVKEGLMEALHHCVTPNQAADVLELALVNNDILIDVRLFAALCCLAERALNLYFLPLARKEVIEMVDFEALEWKLRGCTITPSLQTLFAQL